MKESKREGQGKKNETELLHLTRDNLTNGDKRNTKMLVNFQWQRPMTLLPG